MEYIIAVGLTFVLSLAIIKIGTKKSIISFGNIKYSQSATFEKTRQFMPKTTNKKPKIVSQAMKHVENHMVKIIVVENKAYWVKDNIFYMADTNNGKIIGETAEPIDTANMSKKDIDKMLFILDNLGKGKSKNDSGSAGN